MARTTSSATAAARLTTPYGETITAKLDLAENRARTYAYWANYATESLKPIRDADLHYPCTGVHYTRPDSPTEKCDQTLNWRVVVGSSLDTCLSGRVGAFRAWVHRFSVVLPFVLSCSNFFFFSFIPVSKSWVRLLWANR